MTDARRPAIVDVWMQHPTTRFLNHPAFASLRRWLDDDGLLQAPPLEATIDAMDRTGVEVGLLSAWHGPEGELISNDEVAGWIARHPNRFRGLASVDLRDPMGAVRTLRRYVREEGFVGLRIVPWLWERPPNDRYYYPLYATCVDLDVPVCTQVGHTGPLRPSSTGHPIPYLDDVALDFPELVIVAGHIGYPWTDEMVAVARKHSNVHIDTSAYTARRYPDQLVDYLRNDGASKVLFGTNYPMLTADRALEHLDELALADQALTSFLAGNARRLFNLDRTSPDPSHTGHRDD